MNELQNAVEKLRASNISAEFRSDKIRQIIGGIGVSEISGIKVYKKSFSVTFEGTTWVVRLPGEGQLINEYFANSLEDAVDLVLEIYS
jgi:predicted phage-related endonuclease